MPENNAFIVRLPCKTILWEGYVPMSRSEEWFAADYKSLGNEGMSEFCRTLISETGEPHLSQTTGLAETASSASEGVLANTICSR